VGCPPGSAFSSTERYFDPGLTVGLDCGSIELFPGLSGSSAAKSKLWLDHGRRRADTGGWSVGGCSAAIGAAFLRGWPEEETEISTETDALPANEGKKNARAAAADTEHELRDVNTIVGSAIRKLRRQRSLSLRARGELTGFSISFLSLVERGRSSLALSSLQKVATALGTDVPRRAIL
jgi:hypothetical protein